MKDIEIPDYGRLSREEIEVGLLVAQVGLGSVDYQADRLRLDVLSGNIFGLQPNADLPRDVLHDRIHPEDWPTVAEHVDGLLRPDGPDVMDLTHRVVSPAGDIQWINVRKQVIYDGDRRGDRPTRGIFALVDVTDQKRAQLREDMLLAEINHRSKNLISVVSGIVRELDRHSEGDLAERIIARLTALAANQDALVARGSRTAATLAAVVTEQAAPFETGQGARVKLDGPDLHLTQDAAQGLAMVLHELLTNAVKYGALSGPAGHIDLSWQIDGGDLRIAWRERGGPEVTPPTRSGFGTRVVTRLMQTSFGAEVVLDWQRTGLHVDITAPAEAMLAA